MSHDSGSRAVFRPAQSQVLDSVAAGLAAATQLPQACEAALHSQSAQETGFAQICKQTHGDSYDAQITAAPGKGFER